MEVYVATNEITGLKYVGISTLGMEHRRIKHKSCFRDPKYSHVKFYRAIAEYGWDSFTWEVVAYARTQEELWKKEQDFIYALDTFQNGYNSNMGGKGNRSHNIPLLPPEQAQKSLVQAMKNIERLRGK